MKTTSLASLESIDRSRQANWILTLLLFIGLFLGIFLGIFMPNQFSIIWQRLVLVWLFGFIVVHFLVKLMSEKTDWLSLDKIFILAYAYFHFDFLVLFLTGIIDFDSKAIPFEAYSNLTTYLLAMCLFIFIFGYDIVWNKKENKNKALRSELLGKKTFESMISVGKYLIVLGFGMVFIFIFQLGLGNLISRDYGFQLFYSGEYETILFTGGRLIFAVGFLFFALDFFHFKNRFLEKGVINWILLILVSVYVLALLFLFSVRSWLLLDIFLPALFSYHYLNKRLSFRNLILGALFFIISSIVIQLSRGVDTRTLSGFVETLNYNFERMRGDLAGLLAIQYRTYRNVNWTMVLMEGENTWFKGSTIIGGILLGFPVLGKYLVGEWYEPPSQWLARVADPWAYRNFEGIGFSLPAEAYMNFGLIGAVLVFFLLGIFCAKLYSGTILKTNKKLYSYLFYLSFSINILFTLRQNVASISRPLISMSIIYFMVNLISRLFL